MLRMLMSDVTLGSLLKFLMSAVIDLFQVWTWISFDQILGYQEIMKC